MTSVGAMSLEMNVRIMAFLYYWGYVANFRVVYEMLDVQKVD